MASRGRKGLAGAVPGSVAEAVVAGASVPVLLVPPHFGARAGDGAARWTGQDAAVLGAVRNGAPTEPLRLSIALDGSPEAEAALPPALALARALGATVGLVRVVPSGCALFQTQSGPTGAVGAAATYLERVAVRVEAAGLPPGSVRTAVRFGPVPEMVLDQAAREHASVLVVATHARAGQTRFLLGSVTARVLAQAALPVLVVRAVEPPGNPRIGHG
jgi:nucleotide-binding universal stress UspA family protein